MRFSIVIPAYNEEGNIPELYKRLTAVMERLCSEEGFTTDNYEIIMVNDGSNDNSWRLIKELHSKDPRVKGISLSKNFGHHAALTAGLDHAVGQVNIIMDADLQAQPEDIPKAIAKIKEGSNIVWAVSEKREDNFIARTGAKIFYLLMSKIASVKIPANVVFMCFDRRSVDAIKSFREKRQLPAGIWSDIGFESSIVFVEKKERFTGKTKYSFLKRLKLFITGVVSYSKSPLRLVTAVGLFMASISFLIGIYMVIQKLFFNNPISGYTSIIVAVTLLSGVQLIALGIIAEYLGVVFDEIKNRPIYIVGEKTE